MRIIVHRGTNHIGGCITEYECNGWRLFVDYGSQLPGTNASDAPISVEGLTCGDVSRTALLLTHYHGDHMGEIDLLPESIPVYMGKLCREIAVYYSDYVGNVSSKSNAIAQRLKMANIFTPGRKFKFGPFEILPLNVDHSAFDAYAFRIEANGKAAFHTGDFRAHGFRSGKLEKAHQKYIGPVDYVISEATNIKRIDASSETEHELQQKFKDAFCQNKHNIVYLSSTNIDRLFSLYRAAVYAKRPFFIDGFQKQIMNIVAKSKSLWTKSSLYQFTYPKPITLKRDEAREYILDPSMFGDNGFVLIARANCFFNNLISKLPKAKKYLSMWNGYLKEGATFNAALAEALADGYAYLHTSGHCDTEDMERAFKILKPHSIISIHTDDPSAFKKRFSQEWDVVDLTDGQSFDSDKE